jgi:phosphoribosylanthranilate isomerase
MRKGLEMPKVKICANTNAEDAVRAVELGADYLGLIFTESKRKVNVAQAKSIMAATPGFSNYVGVFANQAREDVESIAKEVGLLWFQFHGNETSRYCDYFAKKKFNVIKTFKIKDAMSLKRIDEYSVGAYMFDTYSREVMGGSGVSFDWSVIEDKPYVHEKLFLSGGLNPENVGSAIARVNPYAVDVASGVEKTPGVKDHAKLEQFISIAKNPHPKAEQPRGTSET